MHNCISLTLTVYEKHLTNKHTRVLWKARVFPGKHCDAAVIAVYWYLEKL